MSYCKGFHDINFRVGEHLGFSTLSFGSDKSLKAKLKNMKSGEETIIALDDSFIDNFANIHTADMLAGEF